MLFRSATLRNVSFVNNFAITGGGILNEPDTYHSLPGRIILVNTVVAYNRTNATSHNDCLNSGGTLISRGNNLIQAPGNCTLTNDTSNFGSADLLNADPIYENIAGDTYSGGNIPAPLLTSPLIDRGKQDECVASNNTVTDILGEVRLGPCDIGAVESKLNISLPSVSISIPESSTTVSLRINQSFTTVPNTIQYTTQDETATSGRDYVASSGSITFPPYITSNNLTLNLAPDDTVHDGDKTFLVILSSSTPGVNISYSRLIARITIIDNDPLPPSTGGSSGGAGTGGAGGSSGSSGSGGFGSGGASATGGASGGSGGQTEISTGGTGGQESIGSGGTDDTDPLQDNTEQETGGSTDSGTGGSTVNEDNTPLIPNAGGCSIAQG